VANEKTDFDRLHAFLLSPEAEPLIFQALERFCTGRFDPAKTVIFTDLYDGEVDLRIVVKATLAALLETEHPGFSLDRELVPSPIHAHYVYCVFRSGGAISARPLPLDVAAN
jgi:hypothetical protein